MDNIYIYAKDLEVNKYYKVNNEFRKLVDKKLHCILNMGRDGVFQLCFENLQQPIILEWGEKLECLENNVNNIKYNKTI